MNDVARVTEITARSSESFEHAIQIAIERATRTLRNVSGAWVKEQKVKIRDGVISQYHVDLMVTFVLDDTPSGDDQMATTSVERDTGETQTDGGAQTAVTSEQRVGQRHMESVQR